MLKVFVRMSIRGKKVRSARRAINIDKPVKRPKQTVGVKFERARIEKPIMIVSDV